MRQEINLGETKLRRMRLQEFLEVSYEVSPTGTGSIF
jgi:hypothetical protein